MDWTGLSDEDVVRAAKTAPDGDLRAVDVLIRRYRGRIVANCRYLTRSAADAEDLSQEVFVKVFFALRRFEERSLFRTWLQRIKINHCLNFLRGREASRPSDVEVEDVLEKSDHGVEPEAERRLAAAELRRTISRVLDGMGDTLRIPLIMRDMDGMAYQEIAEVLGVGLSAVKMRIKRGREEFRRRLESDAPDAGT